MSSTTLNSSLADYPEQFIPGCKKAMAMSAILIMEIQGATRSPQATVLLPKPVPVSADKARSFPK
jgi:hypothetical protein